MTNTKLVLPFIDASDHADFDKVFSLVAPDILYKNTGCPSVPSNSL